MQNSEGQDTLKTVSSCQQDVRVDSSVPTDVKIM